MRYRYHGSNKYSVRIRHHPDACATENGMRNEMTEQPWPAAVTANDVKLARNAIETQLDFWGQLYQAIASGVAHRSDSNETEKPEQPCQAC
ncbi:unnamed protein product [Gongylonema pulchrum]|uniref:DZF domain-containing protein n=1 Tax=Gongylonema pulchrum TaxID=637853 RepID=A0A183ET42_9BILA|nr:unnamed protein product [Gongylonema pulchrum]